MEHSYNIIDAPDSDSEDEIEEEQEIGQQAPGCCSSLTLICNAIGICPVVSFLGIITTLVFATGLIEWIIDRGIDYLGNHTDNFEGY